MNVEINGHEIQLVNTHLGLLARERMAQVEALLGADWLGHPDCGGPLILCGDFNALPRSKVYRRVAEQLRDVQHCLNGHRPQRTWFSHHPVGRIDHVFVGEQWRVVGEVPRSNLVVTASDHLPLIVEIELS